MGRFRTFLRWYRLKSNDKHLFLKVSGQGYLDDQPVSVQDAEEFANEIISETSEIGTILNEDQRTLILTIDIRDADTSTLNILPFIKFCQSLGSQGHDIDKIEVLGADDMWAYACRYAPKYARDRMIFI